MSKRADLAAINAELNALDWQPPLRRLPSLDAAVHQARPNAKPPKREKTCAKCGVVFGASFKPSLLARMKYCSIRCASVVNSGAKRLHRADCPICGKPSPFPKQQTCSASCGYRWRKLKLRTPKSCAVCKKEFFPHKSLTKFCSLECYRVDRARREQFIEVNCHACGKRFRRTSGALKRTKHHFCGNECSARFNAGTNHVGYRGGSEESRGSGWLTIAARIRERDGHTCRRCGRKQSGKSAFPVDHIVPWRCFTDERQANDPSNLATLCGRCHGIKTHRVERRWFAGDALIMDQFRKTLNLEPLSLSPTQHGLESAPMRDVEAAE